MLFPLTIFGFFSIKRLSIGHKWPLSEKMATLSNLFFQQNKY